MRPFFPFLICFSFLFSSAVTGDDCFAQKQADLALSIVAPLEGELIPNGDTVDLIISIKNLGPHALDSLDKVFVNMEGDPISTMYTPELSVGDSAIYPFAGFINGRAVDTPHNVCFYVRKDLNTTIEDTVQGNDSICINFILQGENTGLSDVPVDVTALSFFPNPANSAVRIDLAALDLENAELIVRDIKGRVWKRQNADRSEKQAVIYLQHIPPGIYALELHSNKQKRVGKLTILRQ